MIVMKFGGTSVQDGPAMQRAVEIVERENERRPVVVVSAIAGATDALLRMGQTALSGDTRAAQEVLSELVSRHRWILFDLGLSKSTEREVADVIAHYAEELENFTRGVVLLRELTPRIQDAMVSYGERLSVHLLTTATRARGLDTVHIDAREVMLTDARFGRARPDKERIAARCQEKIASVLQAGKIPIIEGFVGSTGDGEPTTLGRGGSDFTAALLGAALEAEEIQIWTDVEGMLTADHRLVPEGKKIRELSFAEAAELAYFGARVLHPSTIEPAVSRDIPVRILNSRRPHASGTTIASRSRKTGVAVKSIAAKKGITVIDVKSLRMLMAHGFLKSMFELFDRHEVPVDLVSTSEVSVSLTVDSVEKLPEIVEELSTFSQVTVEKGAAIVCLVGEEIRSTPGIAARAFGALGDINVRMISQGASEMNLSFVVREGDADEAVKRLHREFFTGIDRPEVFESVDTEMVP
jgi:aspartate kinase